MFSKAHKEVLYFDMDILLYRLKSNRKIFKELHFLKFYSLLAFLVNISRIRLLTRKWFTDMESML